MYAIKAIYDGGHFKPMEPVPVKEKYEVIITFTKPINTKSTKRQRLLKYFGSWDDEDVKIMDKIIEERANFSLNRDEI
ncbi:MAG: antitoxin family protein [Spirochaetaceae bacterium]|jgi:predicted DNA-binding antitoxin AbrB/MazE fold protein|nr:antitoxin family protein [Spirochaetaceae bacterium]